MLQEHKQAEALGTASMSAIFLPAASSCLSHPSQGSSCALNCLSPSQELHQLSLTWPSLYILLTGPSPQPVNPSFTHKYPVVLAPHYYIHLSPPRSLLSIEKQKVTIVLSSSSFQPYLLRRNRFLPTPLKPSPAGSSVAVSLNPMAVSGL